MSDETEAFRRRLEALESARKSSSDMHSQHAIGLAALRELEETHHDVATMARGELRGRIDALEAKLDQDIAALNGKLDALLAIEATKAAEKAAKEALAKSIGVFFKVAGAIIATLTAAIGFAKLAWDLAKHKP